MAKLKGMKTHFYDGWWIQRKWHRLHYRYLGNPYFEFFNNEHHKEMSFSAYHYEWTWTFHKKQLCDKGCCYR